MPAVRDVEVTHGFVAHRELRMSLGPTSVETLQVDAVLRRVVVGVGSAGHDGPVYLDAQQFGHLV